ncbi:hypothetical protein ACNA06_05070 [Lysinibacillus sp. RSDA_15]|uniref:hypothetical protein n=1 Tax=Lysinibacillus TaxID=400634 RepID=UPI0004DF28C3|nr:hypothetical protein [Lysinibacillus sphaericus]QPA57429.1 hypothetical protein INQ55_14625 [Lysinibacillus sphaericus]QTB21072.1 hypothetical protein J1907_14905 [Lysinibacillus sphaericus]
MKVVIKSYEESNEEIKVVFSSKFGEGIALWQGAIPKEGNSYDVELEIPNLLKWGKDIQGKKSNCFLIEILDNKVCFEGTLESISEEDGCCVVRLGDSIILLETEGVPLEVQSYLRFETDNIILYENNR